MEEKISEAIKNAIEGAPERKFVESLDIAFTIKDVDLKNPNNRIQEEIRLPNGRGKDIKIAMFAASDAAQKAKAAGIHVIDPSEIEELGKNKGTANQNEGQPYPYQNRKKHNKIIKKKPTRKPKRKPKRTPKWKKRKGNQDGNHRNSECKETKTKANT